MARKPKWPLLLGSMVGAGLVYFLDPDKGTTRRQKLGPVADRVTESASSASTIGSKTFGTVKETVSRRTPDNPDPDDNTLRDRVESEVFRDPGFPKGDVNINVAEGIVELRGELKDQASIDNLVKQVKGIDNVRGVHNYLHLPGTPAPNKEEAIEAS
ncbi:MAG TPA: BON domain-containing protein [Chloroflexota bacterium]